MVEPPDAHLPLLHRRVLLQHDERVRRQPDQQPPPEQGLPGVLRRREQRHLGRDRLVHVPDRRRGGAPLRRPRHRHLGEKDGDDDRRLAHHHRHHHPGHLDRGRLLHGRALYPRVRRVHRRSRRPHVRRRDQPPGVPRPGRRHVQHAVVLGGNHRVGSGARRPEHGRRLLVAADHVAADAVLGPDRADLPGAPGVAAVAVRQQQARPGQGDADAIPRQRQRGERVGPAAAARVRGAAQHGRRRQAVVGLQRAVPRPHLGLPPVVQRGHLHLRPVGRQRRAVVLPGRRARVLRLRPRDRAGEHHAHQLVPAVPVGHPRRPDRRPRGPPAPAPLLLHRLLRHLVRHDHRLGRVRQVRRRHRRRRKRHPGQQQGGVERRAGYGLPLRRCLLRRHHAPAGSLPRRGAVVRDAR